MLQDNCAVGSLHSATGSHSAKCRADLNGGHIFRHPPVVTGTPAVLLLSRVNRPDLAAKVFRDVPLINDGRLTINGQRSDLQSISTVGLTVIAWRNRRELQ